VHNDFHQTNGIFPLFDGLCVKDINKTLEPDINGHGHMTNGTEEENVERNSNSAITNGIK
jgi:methylenetetrahydrofolate reductase (NADPH)